MGYLLILAIFGGIGWALWWSSCIPCPACGKNLSTAVKFCAGCGKKTGFKQNNISATKKWGASARRILVRCGLGLGIVLFALFLLGTFIGPGEHDKPIDAFYMCQDLVAKQLKSPTTAVFAEESEQHLSSSYQGEDDTTVILEKGQYVIRSHVDSQNGFGALIRTRFECSLTYAGDKTWNVGHVTLSH